MNLRRKCYMKRENDQGRRIEYNFSLSLSLSLSGSAAQCGLWPPRSRGFVITHNDVPQSVGLLWMSDQLVAETSTWQHKTHTTNIHALWGDANPQSQLASGRRPTQYTILEEAIMTYFEVDCDIPLQELFWNSLKLRLHGNTFLQTVWNG
jgi:hypothetical protein